MVVLAIPDARTLLTATNKTPPVLNYWGVFCFFKEKQNILRIIR